MTTLKPLYTAAQAMTIGLTGLASDAALIAGRQSTPVDNTTTRFLDAFVGGFITTGTTPTAGGTIEIWVFASYDGTNFSAGAGAADANFSPTGEKLQMRLAHVITVDGTSNHRYEFGPFSVASFFGLVLPIKWGVFVVHNTGVALHVTATNHEFDYMGLHAEAA